MSSRGKGRGQYRGRGYARGRFRGRGRSGYGRGHSYAWSHHSAHAPYGDGLSPALHNGTLVVSGPCPAPFFEHMHLR